LTRSPTPYQQLGGGAEVDIHARAELDQPHSLAALQHGAELGPEDDAAGNQAGDLDEDHHSLRPLDAHLVAFVFHCRCRV